MSFKGKRAKKLVALEVKLGSWDAPSIYGKCVDRRCGEPFQAWEMWLRSHLEKPVGSEVGGQDPRPRIGSPVGNQACIVPRLL